MKDRPYQDTIDFVQAGAPLLKDVSKTEPYKVAKKAFKNRGNRSKKNNKNKHYKRITRRIGKEWG